MCDKKKSVYDEDIASIVENDIFNMSEFFALKTIQMSYVFQAQEDQTLPSVKLVIEDIKKGKQLKGEAVGDGPVDAIYKAIEAMIGSKATLLSYNIRSVTSGKDAQGEVSVKLKVYAYG